MFEFNENYACLKFNLCYIFTAHKYTFHQKNLTNFTCKARVTPSHEKETMHKFGGFVSVFILGIKLGIPN